MSSICSSVVPVPPKLVLWIRIRSDPKLFPGSGLGFRKNHSLSGQPESGAETSFKVGSRAEENHYGSTTLDQNPVISCSHKKMKYSTLTGSFSYDGINEFLRDLSYGKGRTNPVKGQPSSPVSLLIKRLAQQLPVFRFVRLRNINGMVRNAGLNQCCRCGLRSTSDSVHYTFRPKIRFSFWPVLVQTFLECGDHWRT
jgi:hypothetical protein